ncbi:MAG: hypothetical protein KGM47_13020, partial [Acidobacteriota bacterium]|nr:hypothetical protein [Acidobacteriota bacterium]
QNAKAAGEKAAADAVREVQNQAQKSIEDSAEHAIARIEASQRKLQTQSELSVAEHQKQLLQLSVQGVEGIQRQLDSQLEAFRGQLQSNVRMLEQKALEKATEDFPAAAASLIENASAALQKKADEASASARDAFKEAAAALAEDSRRTMIQDAGDSLRSLREQEIEQSKTQLRSILKDGAVAQRKEFATEIEGVLRKQKKSMQQQIDEACQASLVQLQQASANLVPGYAPQTSSASRWALVVVALIPTILFLYLMNRPVMRLKSEPPAEFLNAYPEWTSQHQDVATKMGEAYWDWAALHLARDYPFGSSLPEQPPPSFEVEGPGFPTGVDADLARMRYWNKLRELWTNPQSWERVNTWNRH